MSATTHLHFSDLRGIQRLASDATVGITDLVEAMHLTISRAPRPLGEAPKGRTDGITGLVYGSVRGVTRLVGNGLDLLLGAIAPRIAQRQSSQEREAVLAALNGMFGDYLADSQNPLAIPMSLRINGKALTLDRAALAAAIPEPAGKLLVLAHGLCMNDLQWRREGHDHGAALARDLGWTPIYLHYNSGRHISSNGREFADTMETLLREWPYPLESLAIVGHSMGGLVARSACHHAAQSGQAWPRALRKMVFLGTPHDGAPLARAGAFADFLVEASPYSAPFARLGKARSAGIHDLRHACLRDEDWRMPAAKGHAHIPLPAGIECYAVAASKQEKQGAPSARMRGDGLVPVASALGCNPDPALDLGLPEAHRWVGHGMNHFDLLSRADVYRTLHGWLSTARLGMK